MTVRPGRRIASLALAGALSAAALPTRAARPLEEQVTITRDTFGVPHITGETDEAVAFGLGYAQAEDHPTLLARRVLEARGEAASVFGEEALENDLNARRADNVNEAKRHLPDLDAGFRAVLRAFAAGANRYFTQHRGDLPGWTPTVGEADLLAASRGDAVDSAFAPWIERALQKKYVPSRASAPLPPCASAPVPPCAFAPVPPCAFAPVPLYPCAPLPSAPLPLCPSAPDWSLPAADAGSNALALAGRRTTSGRPILLGNPHLRWSSRYWEAHLIVPGRLNFYGSTLVGIPWLRAGFNDRLGYVQTNNSPEDMDVYAFEADPVRPDAYVFEGRSRALARREVHVGVLRADGSIDQEHRTYWLSDLGPVVLRTPDRVFILKSAGLDSWRHFEGFYHLSRARSLGDYERVMRRGLFSMSNFTYADADGHVLYRWMARLPKRPAATTAYPLDVPGDKRLMWTRVHPVEDLPRLLDPPGGSLQNANNAPWFTTTRDRLDPSRYPPSVEHGDLSLRAQVALQMLDATARFSPDDVVRLKYTTRSLLADRVKPALLDAIATRRPASPDLLRARDVLAAWDNRMDVTSVGAVLFTRFWETYRTAAAQPFAERWDERRPFETPAGLGDPALALDHLEQAARWSREKYGSEAVAWGDVHRFQFGSIDLPADGASGQLGVYRVMQFDEGYAGRRVAGWGFDPGTVSVGTDAWGGGDMAGGGDAWVLLVHFTKPVQAWSVLAYGQAGDRRSPHASDQIRVFAARQLRPVYFTQAEIAAHQERVYRP